MEMKILRNGAAKTSANRKRRRRRNPTTATAKAKPVARRNRTVSVARAKSVLAKNGLKAVSKTVANRKRRKGRKRRNGITVTRTAKNGFLGNTKQDAFQVGAVIAGAVATQTVAGFVNQIASPYMASFGFGQYTNLAVKGVTSLFLVPMLAGMVTKKPNIKDFARIGGLVVFGVDLVNYFFPSLALNPFSSQPIVLAGGQALLTPAGAVGLAAAAGADQNTQAKMAGAINAVGAGFAPSGYPTYSNPMVSGGGSGDDWE